MAVMHQVGTTDEARQAVDGGVDLVIAQGVEAGGHVRGTIGLLPLLISIINAVPDTPVIAAGGIVDCRGLAAVLAAGADAASIGTRFIATNESEAHPDYKKRLISAREVDTVHTELHHIGWPPHSPVRVLRSALTDGTEKLEDSIGRMRRGDEIVDVKPFSVVMPTIHVEGTRGAHGELRWPRRRADRGYSASGNDCRAHRQRGRAHTEDPTSGHCALVEATKSPTWRAVQRAAARTLTRSMALI
jgi:NAD(P)H-dependent flavin oxidoreductase YrpB (nitropropane dioxygenase family)